VSIDQAPESLADTSCSFVYPIIHGFAKRGKRTLTMMETLERGFMQLPTAQLKQIVEGNEGDFDVLHSVFVELLFRKRKLARELRSKVSERLAELEEQYFPWPSTEAQIGEKGLDDSFFHYSQGLLGFMGYRVGASGIGAARRQELLHSVYVGRLPSLNSKSYMAEWGLPQTKERLRKIAESIAAFVRNAKRRQRRELSRAISQWEADLEFLKRAYYVGKYDFGWPDTN
jgi:hypothetical protein